MPRYNKLTLDDRIKEYALANMVLLHNERMITRLRAHYAGAPRGVRRYES